MLDLWHRYPSIRIEVIHVGPEDQLTVGDDTIEGVPVGEPLRVAGDRGSVRIRIGDWASGLYALRMTSGDKVGFAPFIVRPKRLGEQPRRGRRADEHVAGVQLPRRRRRRQAGHLVLGKRPWVDTLRPYLDRGVPPHFRSNDLTFVRWLAHTGRKVDMLAQDDLEHVSGDRLAKLYRLIIFPGHHEYVTKPEYDAVRATGTSAATSRFSLRTTSSGASTAWATACTGSPVARPRPPGGCARRRPVLHLEPGQVRRQTVRLVGAQFAPWLVEGTGLENGDHFALFGTEADRVTPASPPELRVLATIPHIFNAKHSASMTYYELPSGARVFAAGAFTLAGPHLRCAQIARFLANLWDTLAEEPEAQYSQADLGSCPYGTDDPV